MSWRAWEPLETRDFYKDREAAGKGEWTAGEEGLCPIHLQAVSQDLVLAHGHCSFLCQIQVSWKGLCRSSGGSCTLPMCTHGHPHPAPGPARPGSRFLPGAAAAGGIGDLLMKRRDCAAGACQAEMSAPRDWITLWPASLRSLQTAAAPRSTISFSSPCQLPPSLPPPWLQFGV